MRLVPIHTGSSFLTSNLYILYSLKVLGILYFPNAIRLAQLGQMPFSI